MEADWTSLMRRWGEFGRQESPYFQRAPGLPQWKPCQRFFEAASNYSISRLEEIRNSLEASERFLKPLPDPLRMDFPLQRWLAADREEAYSDWFAWILTELRSARQVGHVLFGIESKIPQDMQKSGTLYTVEREVAIPSGHPGQTGRLDCVLRFGKEFLLVVEIKLGRADMADTGKHVGYVDWIKQQEVQDTGALLIATQGDRNEYHGFTLLRWSDICKRLRFLLPALGDENKFPLAALTAAFVSAVEQNLLALPVLKWVGSSDEKRQCLGVLDRLETLLYQLRYI